MSVFDIYACDRIKRGEALIDVVVEGVEYIAEAPRGTAATEAAWICSAVYPIGTTGRRIKHCSGLQVPGVNGELLAALTYV